MKLTQPRPVTITLTLPGPDRKRNWAAYSYRVSYRNPDATLPGCVMTWDVLGGRLPYQVALERTTTGEQRWHCSCADAIYRGDGNPAHRCKHIQGLLECLPLVACQQTNPTPRSAMNVKGNR